MRITKLQKQIVDAHLLASQNKKFDFGLTQTTALSREAFLAELRNGKTFEYIHDQIATRYVSITSLLMANPDTFNYVSGAYAKDYTNGFKLLLNNLNIK